MKFNKSNKVNDKAVRHAWVRRRERGMVWELEQAKKRGA